MAVIKLSRSGKQVQFVDEEGFVFVTSATFLNKLLAGELRNGMILLSRLPQRVSVDRFKPSPVWNPNGLEVDTNDKRVTEDAFANKSVEKRTKSKNYKDRSIW